MTPDEAFAQGWRLGAKSFFIGLVTIVLGLGIICALGAYWEQVEIANAVQRATQ